MKKISTDGFTIVELLTSFTLASVVMILLTNILFTIKESYVRSKTKTELESQFSLLLRALNEDAYNCSYKSSGGNSTSGIYVNFNNTPTCDISRGTLILQNTGTNVVATYKRYDKNNSSNVSTEEFHFPEKTSFNNFTLSGSSTSYAFIRFNINTIFPISGDTETTTARIIYRT